jgi:hypothetical protein
MYMLNLYNSLFKRNFFFFLVLVRNLVDMILFYVKFWSVMFDFC